MLGDSNNIKQYTLPRKLWPNQCTCNLENHDGLEPPHEQQIPTLP